MTAMQKTIKYFAAGFAIFLTVTIVGAILTAIVSIVSALMGWGMDAISDEKDFPAQTVKNIEVDLPFGELVFQTGSSFHVAAFDVPSDYSCKLDGDTLEIKSKKSFSLFHIGNGSAKVVVTVPKNYPLENLDIDFGVGEIDIEQLSCTGKSSIDSGCGEIDLKDVSLGISSIDLGIGEINVDGAINGKTTLDNGIGEINLTVYGNPDNYAVDSDHGIGSSSVKDHTENKYAAVPAKEEKQIPIILDSGIGSISVIFK